MEVIVGPTHAAFPVDDASRVGEARRHAARCAQSLEWGEVDAGRLALVVTELGSNLLRHARSGRLLIAANARRGEVEVLSLDAGPGIAHLQQSMRDGFSTGGTPGTGLGAVRRMAQDFDIHSTVPHGTVVLARLRSTRLADPVPRTEPVIQIGAVCLAAPGETVSGDGWAVCLDGTQASAIMVDGLGHGPDAHAAAEAAIAVFEGQPLGDQRTTLENAHARMRTTRGAAMALLRIDMADARARSVSAGNVVTRIVSGVMDRSILAQHGTVGVQIRRPEEIVMDWPEHALVVIHTDGIETRWKTDALLPVLGRDPALVAAMLLRDHCRGRDDASVLVMRRRR